MADQKQVQANILERVRVLNSEKPGVAVVEFQVKGGKTAFFAMSRKAMLEVSDHLRKQAESMPEASSSEGQASVQ